MPFATAMKTMRCGFCANLGLPNHIVTSHLVRDCKKLAETQCLNCGEFGHTVGRCPLNRENKPKYSRKPFVMRDRPKPEVDSDGFKIQGKRGAASAKPTQHVVVSAPKAKIPTNFGGEIEFKEPEKVPEFMKPRGAWASGAPKPVEIRPHQEIRPPQPKAEAKIPAKPQAKPNAKPQAVPKPQAMQYMSTQSTGGNYATEEEIKQRAAKQGLSCWADDDDDDDWEADIENDPFFQ